MAKGFVELWGLQSIVANSAILRGMTETDEQKIKNKEVKNN
jgi:hypothetical protein